MIRDLPPPVPCPRLRPEAFQPTSFTLAFTRRLSGLLLLAVTAVGLGGCRTPPVYGLRPIEPPVWIAHLSDPHDYLDFPEIDSLRPMLRWTAFSADSAQGGGNDRIENVSYDLRVWRMENGYPTEQVYARDDLRLPEHHLETPLRGSTKYGWSVRARFLVNGKTRVGTWSYTKVPWTAEQVRDYGSWSASRVDEIPAYNMFRFRIR